jgi:hypothetical protein
MEITIRYASIPAEYTIPDSTLDVRMSEERFEVGNLRDAQDGNRRHISPLLCCLQVRARLAADPPDPPGYAITIFRDDLPPL